jgi:hypothetical protein
MPDSYPYIVSNNKIEPILKKIRSAAKPTKFTNEFLKQLGFLSSNDRAIISILRGLGFITDEGAPTEYFDRLKDSVDWQFALGERMKELYKDIFNIDTEIHKSTDQEIKGAIARVTGKDDASVSRYLATFKVLANLANFETSPRNKENPEKKKEIITTETKEQKKINTINEPVDQNKAFSKIEFCHNIEIHLPATTDISVYNAIFKSIRDNLINE